jgi:acetylornithine deacetylase/succinyl-diaminopimelate desuccinylase-like protein
MKRNAGIALIASIASGWSVAPSAAEPAPPDAQKLTREVYKELVEINTTESVGDTYAAAKAMAARLVSAGFPRADVQVFQSAPKRGNLVARLRGTGKRKPLLLVAHLDVVEAKREDWTTDPFKLVEKDGYFYGRGTGDDKYMATAWVVDMMRWKKEGWKPERDIILVLETDEEITDRNHIGIQWLIKNHRDLIDAEYALNEGGGVGAKDGKPFANSIQTAEKQFQTFVVETRNSGGHSSQPRKDNAIYELADARVLREDGGGRARPARAGHEVGRERKAGPRRDRAAVGAAAVQRAAADDLRRDQARGRPRRERAAAARARDGELPDRARPERR